MVSGRGGARRGAGRPRGPKASRKIVSVPDVLVRKLEHAATLWGVTRTEIVNATERASR